MINQKSEAPPRLSGETEKSYRAFLLYHKLGSKRSIDKVAKQLGKAKYSISTIATKWTWEQRILEKMNE
jgi:hypothetical protein